MDYRNLIELLQSYADAFVLNISSPNTPDLRKLLDSHYFENFLDSIVSFCKKLKAPPPLLLKMSPDLSEDQFFKIIQRSEHSLDGWVLCNTTASTGGFFPASGEASGGISGRPLAQKSKKFLKQIVKILGENKKNKLIVSSGGCLTAQDVFERLQLGADLVQVYSALVFEGPQFFKKVYQSHFS